MKEFKQGDKVWSAQYGYGVVQRVKNTNTYQVCIDNNNGGRVFFTVCGRTFEPEVAPTLFHADEIPDFYKPYAQDPRIGKWGYFWENNFTNNAVYGKLHDIKKGKYVTMFINIYYTYDHFSIEPPDHCK